MKSFSEKVFIFLFFILLLVVSSYFVGIRDVSIGTDTISYINIFDGALHSERYRHEIGFYLFAKFFTLFLILLPLFFIYINESYALIVMSFFLMFVFMLIRGALITVNIVWAEKTKINMSVIIGIVVSFLVILLCILIYQEEINIGLASFYICLSSWVTAMVLLYNKKRFIK